VHFLEVKFTGKSTVVPVKAMKAHRLGRHIASLILHLRSK